jgi:predicted MPP superfamily phosphohydrolase
LEIRLVRLPEAFDGFTIAQLSDFHYEDHFSIVPIRKAVEVVNELHPDLIVLTGDFVTVPFFSHARRRYPQSARNAEPCAEILHNLRAAVGRFAVLGNHDSASNPVRITGALRDHGIPVLSNRSVPIERGASRFWLAGIDDALMAHEPDFADESSLSPVDLQLSGHSHGGQVWIPGIGAPWLPALAKKYPRGRYKVGNLTLYTNIGIGTIHAPIRLNCTPEVTLITLRTHA